MSRGSLRETYHGPNQILPELRSVGWVRSTTARPPVGLHHHPHAFEVFYFERGQSQWCVEGEVHSLSANQVYITRPGEIHGSHGEGMQPCGYYYISFRMDASDTLDTSLPCYSTDLAGIRRPQSAHDATCTDTLSFPEMSSEYSRPLCEELAGMKLRCFPGSPILKDAFQTLVELHRRPFPHQKLALRSQFRLLLIWLLQDYREALSAPSDRKAPSHAIRKAVDMIRHRRTEIKSIGQLAKIAGLGTTQFCNRFFAEIGYTPAMFLRKERIEHAKELVHAGNLALVDIAYAAGFSSSQHFATAFRKMEGISPSEYIGKTMRRDDAHQARS